MPIIYIKEIGTHTKLGLWRIDDNEQLEDKCPPVVRLRLSNKCESKQKETYAVYALLQQMTGLTNLIIDHEASGKPHIKGNDSHAGFHISISHTNGYASIIISTKHNVSVDIEYRSNRIKRIAERFLRPDELANISGITNNDEDAKNTPTEELTILLLHWCAKETTFKYYSDPDVTFQNMRVSKLGNIKENGYFLCDNLTISESIKIHYEQNEDYVLTYSYD